MTDEESDDGELDALEGGDAMAARGWMTDGFALWFR